MLLEEILNLPKNIKAKILEEFLKNCKTVFYCNLDTLDLFIHPYSTCCISLQTNSNSNIKRIYIDLYTLNTKIIKNYEGKVNFNNFILETFNLTKINDLDFRNLEESTINYIITCLYDNEKTNNDLLCTNTITYLINL